mgnify:CR=1 FL=1
MIDNDNLPIAAKRPGKDNTPRPRGNDQGLIPCFKRQAASPHTTNAAVKPDANVDLLRDFVPIGQTGGDACRFEYIADGKVQQVTLSALREANEAFFKDWMEG